MPESHDAEPFTSEAYRTETLEATSRPPGSLTAEGAVSAQERERRLIKASQVLWFLAGILEVAIGLRVLLKLLAANPDAGFARFIYGITGVFLAPFFGLLATPSANGAVLELPTIFGMIVYALLVWGIVRAMWLILSPR